SPLNSPAPAPAAAPVSAEAQDAPKWQSARDFIEDVLPHARAAAKRMNVNPLAILAQAALETGWGQHVMPDANGDSSLNLFGIKAGRGWEGETVHRMTVEFDDGVASRKREPFRSYTSLRDTFSDYVNFLSSSDRYQSARDTGNDVASFAKALQSGGYATDPSYAKKIARVASGDTMRDILATLKQTDLLSLSNKLGGD
ncbi:MAG: glucosaminidase domain-containing protein, partial [Pseudomonadota bacterium]